MPHATIPPGEHRVCLNIICKNEAHNLKVLFPASKHLIDHYVVVDTGSNDGTQETVVEEGERLGITGQMIQSQWYDDYGRSREEALDACRQFMREQYGEEQLDRCFALFIDPDEKYVDRRTREAITPQTRKDLEKELCKGDLIMNLMEMGRTSFDRTGFARLSLPFRWEHALHEIVTCPIDHRVTQNPVLLMLPHGIGAHRRQKDRSERDCRILEHTMQRYGRTTRYIFYLAQSLNEAGRVAEAYTLYEERHQRADGYSQERYIAALRAARILLSTPFLLGVNPAQANQRAMGLLLRATEFDQNRYEAPALLAKHLRLSGLYRPAYYMTLGYLRNGGPLNYSPLFEEPESFREAKQELGISAWWAGEQNVSLNIMRDSIRAALDKGEQPQALDESNLKTCEGLVTIRDSRIKEEGSVCTFPLLPEGIGSFLRVAHNVLRNYQEFVSLANACINDMRPEARFLHSPWKQFLSNFLGGKVEYLELHPYSGRVVEKINVVTRISTQPEVQAKIMSSKMTVAMVPILKKAPKKNASSAHKLVLHDGTTVLLQPNSLVAAPYHDIDQKASRLPPLLLFAFVLDTDPYLFPQ